MKKLYDIDSILNTDRETWICSACGNLLDDEDPNEYIARRPVCMRCWLDFCENIERLHDETDQGD